MDIKTSSPKKKPVLPYQVERIHSWRRRMAKRNLTPLTSNDHLVQAKESGCMITASTAHYIHGNLKLPSAYCNEIVTRISRPPRWLTQWLQLTFVPVHLPDNNHYLQYNPDWKLPEHPTPRHHKCSYSNLSGREPLCTCSCCHYHSPTHSPQYYNYSQ